MLDEQKNLVIEGKEINDETNIRVNDHADNVMTLSYYANQIVDPFLCEAFFSVVYLSFTASTVAKEEVVDRFRFLVQLFEQEFSIKWDIDQVCEKATCVSKVLPQLVALTLCCSP
jgi:glycerol-3-phosphate O-acyltransferase